VREQNKWGYMPLHSAAKTGKTDVVRLLMEIWPEGKVTLNADGQTPLTPCTPRASQEEGDYYSDRLSND
jgi:ankyrin repeat protein